MFEIHLPPTYPCFFLVLGLCLFWKGRLVRSGCIGKMYCWNLPPLLLKEFLQRLFVNEDLEVWVLALALLPCLCFGALMVVLVWSVMDGILECKKGFGHSICMKG